MKKGFTLIELLVVIAIIGVLASIVMVSVASAKEKGRDVQRVAQVRNIRSALELYAPPGGTYPNTSGSWYNSVTQGSGWIPTTDQSLQSVVAIDPINSPTNDILYYYISNGVNYCIQLSQERDCSSNPAYAGYTYGSCKLQLGSSAVYCDSVPAPVPPSSGGGGGHPCTSCVF